MKGIRHRIDVAPDLVNQSVMHAGYLAVPGVEMHPEEGKPDISYPLSLSALSHKKGDLEPDRCYPGSGSSVNHAGYLTVTEGEMHAEDEKPGIWHRIDIVRFRSISQSVGYPVP